ncbi:MAG: hypothetical protein JW924_03300 [Fusobacteriaceae bacterium]|nr:hypothetical protein [Fusobacteriaceae bacterium]
MEQIKVGDPWASVIEVIDVETGKPIRGVQWTDVYLNAYVAFEIDEQYGGAKLDENEENILKLVRKKIKLAVKK